MVGGGWESSAKRADVNGKACQDEKTSKLVAHPSSPLQISSAAPTSNS